MRWPTALLRGAVSAAILAVLLSRTPLDEVLARAGGAAPAPLAAALALVLFMYLLVSVRWRLMALALGAALPAGAALRAVFLGLFGGQLLPTTVGSDVVRGWAAARHLGSVPRTAASIVADRLVGLVGVCVLVAALYVALGAAALAVSAALLAGFLFVCKAAPRPLPLAAALVLAVVIHVLHVFAASLSAAAYGVNASAAVWFAVLPVAIIACAVPISINGWGVREAVVVTLAGTQGIAAPDALLVSVTLGLLNTAASLPGAVLLLLHDGK
jgi:hypothetical protein